MATKFMNIPNPSNSEDKKKEFKPTVFTHFISSKKEILESELKPTDFEFVIWLGHDIAYGDVFKVWNGVINDIDSFTIYFGVKGDEDYL